MICLNSIVILLSRVAGILACLTIGTIFHVNSLSVMNSITPKQPLEYSALQHVSLTLVNGTYVCHLGALRFNDFMILLLDFALINQLLQLKFLSSCHFFVHSIVFIEQVIQAGIHFPELLDGCFNRLLLSGHSEQCLGEFSTKSLQMLYREMMPSILASHGASIGTLKCV